MSAPAAGLAPASQTTPQADNFWDLATSMAALPGVELWCLPANAHSDTMTRDVVAGIELRSAYGNIAAIRYTIRKETSQSNGKTLLSHLAGRNNRP